MADRFIRVRTIEQKNAVVEQERFDALILPAACFFGAEETLVSLPMDLYLELPKVARENKAETIRRQIEDFCRFAESRRAKKTGFLIENLDEAGMLIEAGWRGPVLAGEFFYSCNHAAIAFYRNLFPQMEYLASVELTFAELEEAENRSGVRFIYKVYGHQVLMTTAQCLYKDHMGCRKGENGVLRFTDHKKEGFFAAADCALCGNLIYNGKPTFLLDKAAELSGKRVLVDLTVETEQEIKTVLEAFSYYVEGGTLPEKYRPAENSFTRGHYYKKID